MNGSSASVPPIAAGTLATCAGQKLRQIRERLNLTLRAVEEASLEIADAERGSEYVVSIGRLNQIENDGSLPSIYKLYSLAVIYQMSVEEVLGCTESTWGRWRSTGSKPCSREPTG
jgi:transcriptional regulator with XRE-family HTH domain